MEWGLLLLAIGAEVAGTTLMKLSEGLTKLPPTVAMFGFYILSFGALSLTLEKIPVSIAYAIWSGVGTALIVIVGFTGSQSVTPQRKHARTICQRSRTLLHAGI
jgi:small multidrug resistance pump